MGQEHGSAHTGTCHQARRPKFNPRNSQGRRGGVVSWAGIPLTSTGMHYHPPNKCNWKLRGRRWEKSPKSSSRLHMCTPHTIQTRLQIFLAHSTLLNPRKANSKLLDAVKSGHSQAWSRWMRKRASVPTCDDHRVLKESHWAGEWPRHLVPFSLCICQL